MSTPPDPARLQAASARFVAFFRELGGAFLEREDVLSQIALGLLCREHVLLTGPPGTAKSQIASAVFERILDEDTGEPSLFARQLTESTVQTDLIGPINFKTLTETGRTEHFTDEGMLGAVHAFLDEVFDGRDMLLRAALNVLHERELKQGTRITRGRIECALMASNRYLAEVLEDARETLLAFVDRVAFVGFVPRGFADPANLNAVLRRQIGGDGRPTLDAPLTIQDLDALQDAVDSVFVSDAMCESLAALLDLVDTEQKSAARADPGFIPTRYLSTRTAVRSGRILRALCVHDQIFQHPARPLEARHDDLAGLRLHLVLSGPAPSAIGRLLERETDARERRQLGIVRTEREIFDRCFARLPITRAQPRPMRPSKPAPPQQSPAKPPPLPTTSAPPPLLKANPIEERARAALASRNPAKLIEVMRELVGPARAAGPEAERATELLDACAAALHAEGVHAGLSASGDPRRVAHATAKDLGALGTTLEQAGPGSRALARWLRGRALTVLSEAAAYALGLPATELGHLAGLGGLGTSADPMKHAEARVEALEELSSERRALLAGGVDPHEREAADAAWARGVAAAEDDVAALCDAALQQAAAKSLAVRGPGELAEVLTELGPELHRVRATARRLGAIRGGAGPSPSPSPIEIGVLGSRVGALVTAALDRLDAHDRDAFHRTIEGILGVLEAAGLGAVVAGKDWVSAAATVLARSEADPPPRSPGEELDHTGYRRLRKALPRVSNAYVLGRLAVRVTSPAPREGGASPITALLAEVPEPVRAEAARLDFRRIEHAVDYLEAWWSALDATRPEESSQDRLTRLVRSRFFTVIIDESALVRFVLEARLVAEMAPAHSEEAARVLARIDALKTRTTQRLQDLLRSRADAAWAGALGAAVERGA